MHKYMLMGLKYGILDYWVPGLHPTSGIPNSTHSRNMTFSTLRWEGGMTPTQFGPLERNGLNHCTNRPLIISKIYCLGDRMTQFRNPATLLNEVKKNSVYRKMCHVHSFWSSTSYTFHEGQIKWSQFFLKNWLKVKNISTLYTILLIKTHMLDVPYKT